tara:strand:- start:143 stop:457 length:315 start_codon:yes stop_codon:yes gene_type:complete
MISILTLLSPDKITALTGVYHISNKVIVPSVGATLLSNNYCKSENTTKMIGSMSLVNIAFHSYVSCAAVITDYIKPKKLEFITRVVNLKSHILASGGLLWYFIH